ncbi:respiratory nitrate reductase subunit gamma [Desulfatitalea alkaliphila]|uniref:nitrate reductase (quinone) n=1 Tax=Desulfatitalea alkaliphila TaxID=2929485 RepID=A0AA41R4B9_9BACT|nr:respiratory nitrate reductase subunit gamma [Desulfatitalea alkaliphila]MCJ8501712.1 respiratory nitrate reductase subunit gamma [Desulfatitalea alkaliphila]
MDLAHILAFTVFPYMCLATFVLGHSYRYITDRYHWNARSSEFLEKRSLFAGSVIFHWGIILTFFGHAGGMLVPQRYFDLVGIDDQAHLAIAHWSGLAVGIAAFVGIVLLLWRRLTHPRVRAVSTINDTITVFGLLFVITTGLFNVLFGDHNVLYTVAPWIRGIVTFTPDAALMQGVPISFQLHVTAAWALLAFSPFSRLVHIWSAPVFYLFRRRVLFRRHVAPARATPDARRI